MLISRKIFIISEDANLLSALEAKLTLFGLIVLIKNDFNSISDVINDSNLYQADYVILDLMLLRLDSFDLLCSLKEAQGEKKFGLFIYTDLDDSVSRQRAINLGADYYFTKKELNLDQFIDKFRRIIANQDIKASRKKKT